MNDAIGIELPGTYEDCFVAFVDLLGFEALTKQAKDGNQAILTAVKALSAIQNDMTTSTHSWRQLDGTQPAARERTCTVQLRAFSDSVCLFLPVELGSPAWLFKSVRMLHDRMLELGVIVRGAITIGKMYWDPNWDLESTESSNATSAAKLLACTSNESAIVYERGKLGGPITFGQGLVDAHRLEQQIAIYPRIIVSKCLRHHIKVKGNCAFPLARPGSTLNLDHFICIGDDREFYIDLKHDAIDRNDTQKLSSKPGEIRREGSTASVHQLAEIVRKLCASHSEAEPRILQKYQWLANYWGCPNAFGDAEDLRQAVVDGASP